jgi:hypothetical protein
MFRAIAPEKLTLYLFTLSHSTITRDYWGDSEALLQAVRRDRVGALRDITTI